MDYSGLSLNKSTFEERQKNLSYIRVLYILLAIELVVAVIWASFCLYFWNKLGSPIVHWWEFGLAAAIICVLLILACLFVKALRKHPINWAVYGIFTLSFAHLCAFLACWDSTRLFYYSLWILTAVTVALAIYAAVNTFYTDNITALVLVFGAGAVVLAWFVAFSDIPVFQLILVYVPVAIFGLYLAYNLRKTVRNSLFDHSEEDPVSGAVRIWIESVLVVCRLGELVGKMFSTTSHLPRQLSLFQIVLNILLFYNNIIIIYISIQLIIYLHLKKLLFFLRNFCFTILIYLLQKLILFLYQTLIFVMFKEINSLRCRLCLNNESQYYLSCSCLYCQQCLSDKFFNVLTSQDQSYCIQCAICERKISKQIQEIEGQSTFQKKIFLEKLKLDSQIEKDIYDYSLFNDKISYFIVNDLIQKDTNRKNRVEYLMELYISLKNSLAKFDIPLSLIAEDNENILQLTNDYQQKSIEFEKENFVSNKNQTFQQKINQESNFFEAYESQLLKHGINLQNDKTNDTKSKI